MEFPHLPQISHQGTPAFFDISRNRQENDLKYHPKSQALSAPVRH